jgi:hypothetical protein
LEIQELDSLFAADVVGDGTSEVVGMFEAAKTRFFKGTVIPICGGWFSKVNKDYETYLNACMGGCSRRQWFLDLPFGQLG